LLEIEQVLCISANVCMNGGTFGF